MKDKIFDALANLGIPYAVGKKNLSSLHEIKALPTGRVGVLGKKISTWQYTFCIT